MDFMEVKSEYQASVGPVILDLLNKNMETGKDDCISTAFSTPFTGNRFAFSLGVSDMQEKLYVAVINELKASYILISSYHVSLAVPNEPLLIRQLLMC